MNISELLLGQIPEAIFLALFMIIGKDLKTRRIWLTILMTLEYIFLVYAIKLEYTVILQLDFVYLLHLQYL